MWDQRVNWSEMEKLEFDFDSLKLGMICIGNGTYDESKGVSINTNSRGQIT